MQINDLSDDCIRLVLDKFPLKEWIRLRIICHRWKGIITYMAEGKQSLKLFSTEDELRRQCAAISRYYLEEMPDFRIEISNGFVDEIVLLATDRPFEHFLVLPILFPNINRFSSFCPQLYQSDHLAQLLKRWSNLRYLTLFNVPGPDVISPQFWTSLNSTIQTSIETFHLGQLPRSVIPVDVIAPILSRITYFTLIHYRGNLVPILSQLGPNFTKLSLSWVYLTVCQMEQILEANPNLPLQLRHLGIDFINAPKKRERNFRLLFRLICDRFRELRYFDILFVDHLPLVELMPSLTKLVHLNELRLYFGRDQLPPNSTNPRDLPPQKSVRILFLEVFDLTVNQFFHWIPILFPNVQHLKIKYDYDEEKDQDVLAEFNKQMHQQFKCLQNYQIIPF